MVLNPRILFDKERLKVKKYILGIDEVGWGCVAGPLNLGACLIKAEFYDKTEFSNTSAKIKDSKKINEKNRVLIFDEIKKDENYKLFLGTAAASYINEYKLAKAYTKCIDDILTEVAKVVDLKDVLILIDGNRDPKSSIINSDNYEMIIKGDDASFAIAVASLFAKESRDLYMRDLDNSLPQYEFSKHKGYGTAVHTTAIKANGLSIEHRNEACLKLIQD